MGGTPVGHPETPLHLCFSVATERSLEVLALETSEQPFSCAELSSSYEVLLWGSVNSPLTKPISSILHKEVLQSKGRREVGVQVRDGEWVE